VPAAMTPKRHYCPSLSEKYKKNIVLRMNGKYGTEEEIKDRLFKCIWKINFKILFVLLVHHLLTQHTKSFIKKQFLSIVFMHATENYKEKVSILF
jgi:hypothetical protein